VGRANHAYLRHYGVRADRLFFAPHFVDNARFAADADRAREEGHVGRLRQAWGAAATTTVFLFAGKFLARKRAADFVAAVRELAAEGRDVKGVLVGSGPEEAALRSAAAGSRAVVFDGFRNQTEIASRYAAADCLVLPSDGRETWGLVVNEAMATGRPAIVSDAVGCAPDLIDEGRTGFTFPEGDVRILSARMRDALSTLSGPAAPRVRESVLTRVSGYSCEAAVAGTLEALETLGRRRTRVATAKAQHA
jgi:glycosyltransferase involved in cell wall biosynthesis